MREKREEWWTYFWGWTSSFVVVADDDDDFGVFWILVFFDFGGARVHLKSHG